MHEEQPALPLDPPPSPYKERPWTPGPWTADTPSEQNPDGTWGVYEDSAFGPICYVGDPYPRSHNRPAENMLLIAAAPDLYEALEAFTDRAAADPSGAYADLVTQATAAMRKALRGSSPEGDSDG